MSVIRIQKRDSPYIMVDKSPLEDSRLSWKAKGILVYLIGKPNDWKVRIADLISKSSDGRDSVYSGLEELVSYGYMTRQEVREKGKFMGLDYTVYETPVTPDTEEPHTENPDTAKRDTENPPHTNIEYTNKDLTNKEKTNKKGEVASPRGEEVKTFNLESKKKSAIPDGTRGAARTLPQQAVDMFLEVYKKRRGIGYAVKWDRDIKQAKEILTYLATNFTTDEPLELFLHILTRWPELEAADDFYHKNFTLTYINGNTSTIISTLKAGKQSGKRPKPDGIELLNSILADHGIG